MTDSPDEALALLLDDAADWGLPMLVGFRVGDDSVSDEPPATDTSDAFPLQRGALSFEMGAGTTSAAVAG